MYNILLSRIESLKMISDKYPNVLNSNSKIAILPWAFPVELDSDELINGYFAKNGKRRNRYMAQLLNFGVNEKNIHICDCYSQTHDELTNIIENSDAILLPGGNPEMLMNKILHETELFYTIKHYNGIIIGESAGALLQFKRYFITAKNNYYNYLAFYDGIGVISDPFYIDVHSTNEFEYIRKLQEIANEKNKNVYALFDDGGIIYNRLNNEFESFGNVNCFIPKE